MFSDCFYKLARLRFSWTWTLALVAVFAFNLQLLQAQDAIHSDIPFLFFSTLALYLIENTMSRDPANPRLLPGVTAGAVIFAAYAVRMNGLLLLGALFTAQWLYLGGWRGFTKYPAGFLTPYLTFGCLAVLLSFLFPGGEESYLSHYSQLSPEVLFKNAVAYLQLPAGLMAGVPLGSLFAVIMGILFMAGSFSNLRKNAACYCMYCYRAVHHLARMAGLRFLFPILPLIVLMRQTANDPSCQGSQRRKAGRGKIGTGLTGTDSSFIVLGGIGIG
jgi:hypothetical protein